MGNNSSQENSKPELIKSRKPNKEDEFWLRVSREKILKGIEQIEETAKFLVGAITAVTGIFLAADKIAGPKLTNLTSPGLSLVPYLCWVTSLIFAILVVFPLVYSYKRDAPASIAKTHIRIMWTKWIFLLLSGLLFALGVVLFIMGYMVR